MLLRSSAAHALTGSLAAGLLAVAAPAQSQSAPGPVPAAPAVDAAGRVYGDAVVDQRPEWRDEPSVVPAPPPPMAPPLASPPLTAPMTPMSNVPAYAPMGQTGYNQPGYAPAGYDQAAWDNARADWLTECRRRHGHGKTIGGAVGGGVLGGVLGNVIARRGDKTLGTVAGAVAGAVAGGAIGRGADRRASRDYCEAYLDRYLASAQPYYGPQGYGTNGARITYQPMMVMVPVMQQPVPLAPGKRGYTETVVTEEWVPDSRPHRRMIPTRRPQSDKRIRLAPGKRVPIR